MGKLEKFIKGWCDVCGKDIENEYGFYPLTAEDTACGDCWHSYLEWKDFRKKVVMVGGK